MASLKNWKMWKCVQDIEPLFCGHGMSQLYISDNMKALSLLFYFCLYFFFFSKVVVHSVLVIGDNPNPSFNPNSNPKLPFYLLSVLIVLQIFSSRRKGILCDTYQKLFTFFVRKKPSLYFLGLTLKLSKKMTYISDK